MTETDWNELAEEYTKRGFPRNDWRYGYQPVLGLLGDINGKIILDYGCGSGKFSRVLAEKCAKVIAVDPTEKMLELARARDCQNIDYRQIVGNDLSYIDVVDGAVAACVLCGRSDDGEIIEITRNIHEQLRVGGFFIVLDPHPWQRRGADAQNRVRICLEGMQNPVFDYWRPVEKYATLLQESGFTLDTILEPNDELGNPQMLILRGRKCTK